LGSDAVILKTSQYDLRNFWREECVISVYGGYGSDEIARRIKEFGLEEPKKRPADRPYAESRACDPEGNFFDISQHGFEMVETEADRAKQKERA